MSEHGPQIGVTDARQGRRGTRAYRILTISLALVVVALLAIWAIYAGGLSGLRGNREAPARVAQSEHLVPNSAKQAAATAPPGSVAAQAAGRQEQSAGG